jgi:hypothetical protein
MKIKDALKIAIEAMRKEIQSIAVDANFHDLYDADYPAAENAAHRRFLLKQAIKALQENAMEKG